MDAKTPAASTSLWGPALARTSPTARLSHAAPFLRFIVDAAVRDLSPRRIVLFGSRARGDHQARADVDIAFELENQSYWGAFRAIIQEEAPTLLSLDLVDIKEATPELQAAVAREGIVLYERP